MILLDANIVMYAAGGDHPHKTPSARLVVAVGRGEIPAGIDAEALQEILHRYRALRRWDLASEIHRRARLLIRTVEPITAELLDVATDSLIRYRRLDARDATHAAVAPECGYAAICSYDCDFDEVAGPRRVEPGQLLGSRH